MDTDDSDLPFLHGTLLVGVVEAKDLPDKDSAFFNLVRKDYTDAYARVELAPNNFKIAQTKVVNNSLCPIWSEDFRVPVCHRASSLRIIVKDKDMIGSAMVGSAEVDCLSIIENPQDEVDDWFDLKVGDEDDVQGSLHIKVKFQPKGSMEEEEEDTNAKTGIKEWFWNWVDGLLEDCLEKKTEWFPISHDNIPKANSVEDVQEYIKQAKDEGKKVRVCGAQHSAKRAVFDYEGTGKEQVLAFTLEGDLRTIEHLGEGKFLVGAGCNLGIDPLDPASDENNSLCQTMERLGYALPSLGGMSHQTVAGFLSTGSSGGTPTFSVGDCLESIDIVTGNGEEISLQKNTDEFDAAAVSMGLFGVIVRVQIQGQKKYLVRGHEQTVRYEDSVLRDGKSWVEAAREHHYQANVWFPNRGVNSVLQRFGNQNPDYGTKIVDYVHPIDQDDKKMSLMARIGLSLANKLDNPLTDWLVDDILRLLNPIDDEARAYNDHWWRCLPNDDLADIDHKIRVQFTEIWIDVEDAEKVIKIMHEIFKDDDNCGTFGIEMYTSKKSSHWMSMSFGHDVVRVDPYWYEYNTNGTMETFFQPFWDALLAGCPSARLHWGKHFPQVGSTFTGTHEEGNPFERTIGVDYCQKSYPKFQEWLRFREEFDPENVFLTEYWKGILGLK